MLNEVKHLFEFYEEMFRFAQHDNGMQRNMFTKY